MKNIVKTLIFLVILGSLSGCVKKNNKEKTTYLYPAFELRDNKKMWGYIDSKGEFILEPKYDKAYDFNLEGLARVEKNNLQGLVNSKGEEILEKKYQRIFEIENGYIVAFDGNQNQIFNYKGEVEFQGKDDYFHIGPYSDGLFTVSKKDENNNIKVGYMEKSGKLIIEPEYSRAYNFIDGKALVQKDDENFKIIDKNNKLVREIDYKEVGQSKKDGIYLFKGENDLYGLLDHKGDIIIENKFTSIEDIEEDYILVNMSKGKEKEYGIVNKKGDYIIEAKYKDIKLLGQDLFALSDGLDENNNVLYKLVDDEGNAIIDSNFYNLGARKAKVKNDLISLYNGENTYLIDLKGEKFKGSPELSGPGEISFDGKVSIADIGGKRSYYNKNKELIWEEKNDYILKEDARVREETYLEGSVVNIKYPLISGLKNEKAEEKINKSLYDKFLNFQDGKKAIKSGKYKSYKMEYKVNRVNDLLIVEQVAEIQKKNESEAELFAKIYNINLSNGNFYELKDLFEEDSAYLETLSDIIRGEAEQKNEQGLGIYDLSKWEGVKEDQDFIVSVDFIDIYFKPSEILSISEEFPKFRIKQESIDDILDLNSEFWWTYSVNKGF